MQINPEHMPHFTQTAKKDVKKSGIIVGLAYVMVAASVTALIWLFIAMYGLGIYLLILTAPFIFTCILIPVLALVFATSVIRSKNERKYKISKIFLICILCIMPFLFTVLALWGN